SAVSVAVPVPADAVAGTSWCTGCGGVARALGTNHRAARTVPAAVAGSNDRRAVDDDRRTADTKDRSPCSAGEMAVGVDASESPGSRESRGTCGSYAPHHEYF